MALLLPIMAACSALGDTDEDELTVFAAASLHDVMPELAVAWRDVSPSIPIDVSIGGSNTLATQITEGAVADVFLSADLRHPAELVEAGAATGPVMPFADVKIALAAAPNGDIVTSVEDLATPGARIVAAGAGVPISRYAAETLAALAADMEDPALYTRAVESNVVSREDNVRAALAKVELGEGDAAFVYATDLQLDDGARAIPLPDDAAATATYGAVALNDRDASARFLEFLRGDEARAILEEAGFAVQST